MQTNILEYLEQTVTRVPHKTAFANDVCGITFRETYDQARSIGSFLSAEGLYRQPVVVFMKKHPTTLVSFFGTIYSGNYYVPLDDEMPRHRIDLILQTLNPSAVICDELTKPMMAEYNTNCDLYLYDEIAATAAAASKKNFIIFIIKPSCYHSYSPSYSSSCCMLAQRTPSDLISTISQSGDS